MTTVIPIYMSANAKDVHAVLAFTSQLGLCLVYTAVGTVHINFCMLQQLANILERLEYVCAWRRHEQVRCGIVQNVSVKFNFFKPAM